MTKTRAYITGFLLIIFLGIILWVLSASIQFPKESKKPSSRTSSATIDLEAQIRFNGAQFIITNRDTFGVNPYGWTN